ncbi:MAG: cytochrome c3 family protein [Planctomycetota bacterium]|jgi:predicted CXXCH cytochrome family protein
MLHPHDETGRRHGPLRPNRRRRAPARIGSAIALAVAAGGTGALAQSPPTTQMDDCMTSGCHGGMLAARYVHGPTASGDCEVCHVPADVAQHRFDLVRTGATMCDFCHADQPRAAALHVHQPVAEGRCLDCHDPHGSSRPTMLRDDDGGEPCLRCHEAVVANRPVHHQPVATGQCTGCHRAHESDLPHLLIREGRALCLSCHADVLHPLDATSPEVASSEPIAPPAAAPSEGPRMRMHGPVAVDCAMCHDPHASRHTGLLVRSGAELCIFCHAEVGKQVATSTVAHGPMTADQACTNCHNPHVGRAGDLLTDEPVRLCLNCHAEEQPRADGTMVAAVPELADATLNRHGPLREGSCRDCHSPHGAEHAKLLTGPFPTSFYERFDPEAYGLCFRCHDQELALAARTTTATGFRDGDRNLHVVHVQADGGSGRSCRVCHSHHASKGARLTRETVAFGEWKLPIQFTPTETGGSCAAGCHRSYRYDRERPVFADRAPLLPAIGGEKAEATDGAGSDDG